MPTVTYGQSAEYHVFDSLGLELDEAGYVMYKAGNIMTKNGGYVPTVCGKEAARIDDVEGFVHDDEEYCLLSCCFICLLEQAKDEA